ncbi:AAA family ATPase [bacterium Scap17]|nr:AAA family ATPase [bacterium Scap17]
MNFKFEIDKPLDSQNSLEYDKLNRKSYVENITKLLQKNQQPGLVISIEGEWGSGKSSLLAMIEEILHRDEQCHIVKFNPWSIGNKEALLMSFFEQIANTIDITDTSKDVQRVSKELRSYAGIFDVMKFIPGAEPWASILKDLITTTSDSLTAVAEHKEKNLEQTKRSLEEALNKLSRPIVVFIDDVDRLFPDEVYEIIRIIKTIGQLPNISYIVAWDAKYINESLNNIGIPSSTSYIDKITQIRMPVPYLSFRCKKDLILEELNRLPVQACEEHFSNQEKRLHQLFLYGLIDCLENVRDVKKVINYFGHIEPIFRGEITYPDILAMATIITKAPPVYDLLRTHTRLFVGYTSHEYAYDESEDFKVRDDLLWESTYNQTKNSDAIKKLVNYLFPFTKKGDGRISITPLIPGEGHIGQSAKTHTFLQFISDENSNTKIARKYLNSQETRETITTKVTEIDSEDFIDQITKRIISLSDNAIHEDIEDIIISTTRLADIQPFSNLRNKGGFRLMIHENIETFVAEALRKCSSDKIDDIICRIIRDPESISVSWVIISNSVYESIRHGRVLIKDPSTLNKHIKIWVNNTVEAAKNDNFFNISAIEMILNGLPDIDSQACKTMFKNIKIWDHNLDNFAMTFFGGSQDSYKGEFYTYKDTSQAKLEAYTDIEELHKHAHQRITSNNIDTSIKSAWESFIHKKEIYKIDGSTRSSR